MRNTKKPEKTVVLVIGGILKQAPPPGCCPMESAASLESGVLYLTFGTSTDWPQTSPEN